MRRRTRARLESCNTCEAQTFRQAADSSRATGERAHPLGVPAQRGHPGRAHRWLCAYRIRLTGVCGDSAPCGRAASDPQSLGRKRLSVNWPLRTPAARPRFWRPLPQAYPRKSRLASSLALANADGARPIRQRSGISRGCRRCPTHAPPPSACATRPRLSTTLPTASRRSLRRPAPPPETLTGRLTLGCTPGPPRPLPGRACRPTPPPGQQPHRPPRGGGGPRRCRRHQRLRPSDRALGRLANGLATPPALPVALPHTPSSKSKPSSPVVPPRAAILAVRARRRRRRSMRAIGDRRPWRALRAPPKRLGGSGGDPALRGTALPVDVGRRRQEDRSRACAAQAAATAQR